MTCQEACSNTDIVCQEASFTISKCLICAWEVQFSQRNCEQMVLYCFFILLFSLGQQNEVFLADDDVQTLYTLSDFMLFIQARQTSKRQLTIITRLHSQKRTHLLMKFINFQNIDFLFCVNLGQSSSTNSNRTFTYDSFKKKNTQHIPCRIPLATSSDMTTFLAQFT